MKGRALFFVAPEKVEIRPLEIPPPQPNQILVQSLFSAISAGTELLIYRGLAPRNMQADKTINTLSGGLDFPLRYGYSTVGRVIDAGNDVPKSWLESKVFAFHPHQDLFLATQEELFPLPEDLPLKDALFLPNMETALTVLLDGRPLIGEQVLIFGQGVVGLLTTALLGPMPLSTLISLDRHPLRRQASLDLGAHFSLDPEMQDLEAQLRTLLKEQSPDDGADLTYELTGDPEALDAAIRLTGFNGRLLIGSWYGKKRAELDLGGHFHRSRIQLISSQVSTIDPRLSGRWNRGRRMQVAWHLLDKIKPNSLITHSFPFNDAPLAYEALAQEPERTIQVLLSYQEVTGL
jgi:2-desacetyl-2-hydroxyethyl bacteriochlorophyllide A dehydrogenase